MNSIEIYTTKLFSENILDIEYNNILIKKTYDLMKLNGENDIASVRLGWQSDYDIYNNKEFHPLCDYILTKLSSNLLLGKTIKPYISSMWLNVHEQYGFNHVHIHPGAWYSGVYYLNCTNKTGNISFTDPRPGAENNFYHTSIDCNTTYTIKPITGDLILFPSWLPHFVEPNLDVENRVSVAFNVALDI
jgi:uncharacterized protein (TIGR02466 family)